MRHLDIRTVFIIIIVVLTVSVDSYGFRLEGSKLALTDTVTYFIINNQYDKAIDAINADTTFVTDPLFPVLKLVTVGVRDVDFEEIIDSADFLQLYEDAQRSISRYAGISGDTSYAAMLRGLTKAIHATFYLRQKKYFGAMKNLFDAIDLMKKVQETDSLNYEVDLFLGLYEYAQSELRSKLRWVLFWYPGNRKEGIKKVVRCSRNAFITEDAAKLALCEIYLQNSQNNDALFLINHLKTKYPESRFVRWAEVKYLEADKKYLEAAQIYDILSQSYKREPFGGYNAMVTCAKKAQMLYKAGNIGPAWALCTELLHTRDIYAYASIKRDITKLKKKCEDAKN